MVLKRFANRADAEMNHGDVLHFSSNADSSIACRYYPSWTVARVFEGPDGRTYVRLAAMADPTVTKVVLAATLRRECFALHKREEKQPARSEPACEPPLPLRSRQALAAVQSLAAAAAE